jgi:hypothetical protein
MSGSISHGLAMAGSWMSVKLGKLLHALGNCLNKYNFILGIK